MTMRVVGERLEALDRVHRVGRLRRGKAGGFKRFADRSSQIDVVFNDENRGLSVLSHDLVGLPSTCRTIDIDLD